jgi:hypothetical protein
MHVETTQHPCGGDRPIQQTEVAVAAAAAVAVIVFAQDFAQGWSFLQFVQSTHF